MNQNAATLPITEDDAKAIVSSGTPGMNDWMKMALESSRFVCEIPGGEVFFSVGKDQQGAPSLTVWANTPYFQQSLSVYAGQDGNPVTYVRTKTGIDSEGKLVGETVGRYVSRVKAYVGFRPTEARGQRKGKPQSHAFVWLDLGAIGTTVWQKFHAQDFARVNHAFYGVTPETDEQRETRIAEFRAKREANTSASAPDAAQAPPAQSETQAEAPASDEAVNAFDWK